MSSLDAGQSDRQLDARYSVIASRSLGSDLLQRLDIPVQQFVGLALVFLITFLNLVNIHVDKEVVAIDGQVMLKLLVTAIAGLYGAYGVLRDARVRRILLTFPAFFFVVITGLYFVSAAGSITPNASLASTVVLLSVLMMTVTATVQLGLLRVVTTMFHAMSLFVIMSWIVFWLWPEVGVFLEPITDGEFTPRMSGLAHSNTLGQYAGLTSVVGVVLYRCYDQRSIWRVVIIGLSIAALLGSLSRTSLLATIVALAFAYRDVWFSRRVLPWTLSASAVLIMLAMLVSTKVDLDRMASSKMTMFSKSGDAEELTSATGRVDIWAHTLRLIERKPLIGYGAATTKYYLEDYSLYTHNLVLNVAFGTGIVGGLVALAMCVHQLFRLIWFCHPMVNAIVSFILINGLFENVLFSILAGMPTMIWLIALIWNQVADLHGGENSVDPLSVKERFV